MSIRNVLAAAGVALAVAGAAVWMTRGKESAKEADVVEDGARGVKEKARAGKKERAGKNARAGKTDRARPAAAATAGTAADDKPDFLVSDEELAKLTKDEVQAFAELRDASDADNLPRVIAAVGRLAKCRSADVRGEIVSALAWFGVKAMPELTTYMADEDPDVASDAVDRWTDCLAEMSGVEKAEAIRQAMNVLTDPDNLETIAMEINSDIPNSAAVATLVDVIANGNAAAVDAAKEAYEFLTGDEYTTPEAAEAWLAENPDDE